MAALESEMRSFGPAVGDPLSTPGSVRRLEEVAVPWQVFPTSPPPPTHRCYSGRSAAPLPGPERLGAEIPANATP